MLIHLFSFALLVLFCSSSAYAHDSGHKIHRHHELARRASNAVQLHKRFTDARFTYFAVGLGACGQVNVPSDFIVALNIPQYGSGSPGPECFKSITIQYNGKSANAVIMDRCVACPYGGLDFSLGLFTYFASTSEGVIYGTWSFDDAPAPAPSPSPTTPSSTYTPPSPTSTWSPPATTPTTTWKPTPTTTTTTSSATSSSSSSSSKPPASSSSSSGSMSKSSSSNVNSSSGVASGLAMPTGAVSSPGPSQQHNLYALNALMINMGGLLVVAQGS